MRSVHPGSTATGRPSASGRLSTCFGRGAGGGSPTTFGIFQQNVGAGVPHHHRDLPVEGGGRGPPPPLESSSRKWRRGAAPIYRIPTLLLLRKVAHRALRAVA